MKRNMDSGRQPSHATLNERLPWWMYLIGLSYIITFGVIFYLIFWGPAELTGFVNAFSDGAMVIRSVDDPNSPVAKGGLRAADRVLTIDDRPMRAVRDWTESTGNSQAGRSQRWVVSRGGDRVTLEIVPVGVTVQSKLAEGYVQYLILLLISSFLGLLIGWKRPADPVARIGAWFMLTASIAFGFPHGWAVPWRALPSALQLLLWIPQLSRFVLEGIFLSFFVLFPRRLVTRTWVWLVIWAPVVATLPWRAKAFYGVIHPGQVTPVPGWILTAGFVRTMLYLLIGIVVLAVSYRRFLDINEKRRVRVLMLGTAVSMISAIAMVWIDTFWGRRLGRLDIVLSAIVPFNTACPLSLAYAILRHRVLDISVIIRQGLQYALARGAVIGLVPALGALFILDLAVNSQQRLADIFQSRGWIYATAAALSLLAYWKRREWLASIDRRFFRERYNAQQVLRDVVGEIRAAGNFELAAARVVERIATALHPEFVSVMVHPAGEPEYRAVATFPAGVAMPHLTSESKVIALLHVLGRPLEFLHGDSSWLDRQLPREESEFVRRARIDLLAPIAAGPGQTEALLALGVKRSEEPYTREDQELLETITASLALLLEQPSRVTQLPSITFQECPECGVCYEPAAGVCHDDSCKLIPMHIPRMLVGRYRLERRRGQGGMGTVYEATDGSLERRVAIKLIRDEWVDSVEAVQRFRREARAAAGFAHPNVVTIYDYGVESETRAFLVMELLQGATLRDELDRNKRLPPLRLVHIFRGVCAAAEAAHQRELIHRDLKPENIFIAQSADRAGEVIKVLDFGIAKFLPSRGDLSPTSVTAATHTGILVGTPAYMSPEQLMGEDLDVLWDLWALAVVAYETLTGALPFAGATPADWRRAILSGKFRDLSEYLDDPPDRWTTFFARSLAFDRTKRPHSASEFFKQLEQALS
jgi:tRNA A-37 threonylcarbamoyl transferase component Bud32